MVSWVPRSYYLISNHNETNLRDDDIQRSPRVNRKISLAHQPFRFVNLKDAWRDSIIINHWNC